jgi:hypothetical protein
MTTPTPGSADAIKQGCLCPAHDNQNGEGARFYGSNVFWINANCPLHSKGNRK